jgi:DNA-binding GntR family transcriptional regulator
VSLRARTIEFLRNKILRKLLLELERVIAAGFVPEEHAKVMRARRERDPRRAAAAMRDHICAGRDNALFVAAAPSAEYLDASR